MFDAYLKFPLPGIIFILPFNLLDWEFETAVCEEELSPCPTFLWEPLWESILGFPDPGLVDKLMTFDGYYVDCIKLFGDADRSLPCF